MKKLTTKSAKKRAWSAFSLYIRCRDALKTTGTIEEALCITCGERHPIKEMDAGHFVSGRGNAVLFDEELCSAQCKICNIWKHGAYQRYTLVMIDRHGKEAVEEMLNRKHKTVKYKVSDFQEITLIYQEKYFALKNMQSIN